ncbi:transcription elongation factor B polypeptide 1 [Acrasis kona]|uniref:Elongin-C n=1 Tax=Acrasis kona TaxID=1008807 RepID=A0AAW2ZIN7_9EUKA
MSKKPTKPNAKDTNTQFDPSVMIKLVSTDGMEFIVDRRCVIPAKALKKQLESEETTIDLGFSAEIVEKLVQYLYYKMRYDHDPDNRPQFHIEPSIALNLMVAAHYLQT